IVRIAQTRLRGGDAVLGGARPPDDRLRIVVRDTAALAEHAAETLLCERVTGLRGFAIPPRGLREVLLDSGAALIERGQARLRRRIAARGVLAATGGVVDDGVRAIGASGGVLAAAGALMDDGMRAVGAGGGVLAAAGALMDDGVRAVGAGGGVLAAAGALMDDGVRAVG